MAGRDHPGDFFRGLRWWRGEDVDVCHGCPGQRHGGAPVGPGRSLTRQQQTRLRFGLPGSRRPARGLLHRAHGVLLHQERESPQGQPELRRHHAADGVTLAQPHADRYVLLECDTHGLDERHSISDHCGWLDACPGSLGCPKLEHRPGVAIGIVLGRVTRTGTLDEFGTCFGTGSSTFVNVTERFTASGSCRTFRRTCA